MEALVTGHSSIGARRVLQLPFGAAGFLSSAAESLAFTVEGVLSLAECRSLIAAAESAGFSQAFVNEGRGQEVLDLEARNSDRCIIDDEPFAARLFQRLRSSMPESVMDSSGGKWRLVSLNERLRLLRYKVGHSFKRHMDGHFTRSGERSFFTVILYLNDGEEACSAAEFFGGRTTFWGHAEGDPATDSMLNVEPRAGRALVFEHQLIHEGEEIRRGVKYALRTDVMFALSAIERSAHAEASAEAVTKGDAKTCFGYGGQALDVLPCSLYLSDVFGSSCGRLYDEVVRLDFPRHNRGITREFGAPHVAIFSVASCGTIDSLDDPLPPVLVEIIRSLVGAGILRKMPVQVSANHYHETKYCMVPHKDGYADQTAVVSLGADSSLEFWHEPMTAEERQARELMHKRASGTSVYSECLDRPCDAAVWLEPGSVLVLEKEALDDYVHGLRSSEVDLFSMPPAAKPHVNAGSVQLAALRARAAAAGAKQPSAFDDGAHLAVPRRPRVSIVLWTEFTGHSPNG